MTFNKVNPKQSFPHLEEDMLSFWKEQNIFEESINTRADAEEFNFYDGPPFATGTPHYGHILAGTIKDVIPRYQTMLGKKVDRKFGWDCHGLPIENIVEKKLEISGKDDIENKIGVFKFNETCRENVFGYVDEWKKTVERMGRWVDMENDYKTMDTSFMESVWRVFKNIYDKGLIYEGNRVVPYCPRCTTPLSNFEVNQGYKDKQSKTVTVKFKVKNDKPEIDYKQSAGIIVKNSKGQLLYGKKKSNGLLTDPGGKTENCETPLQTAIRELYEETLIKVDTLDLLYCTTTFNNGQIWKEYVYEYIVGDDYIPQNPENHKFEFWKFYDINDNELNEKTLENHSFKALEIAKGLKPAIKYHSTGNKYILAWTTTPWTLYSNLGLAVGEDIDYVELLDKITGDTYILAKAKVKDYYKKEEDYTIVREYKGACLAGIKYEPLFSDFSLQLNEMGKNLGTNIHLGKNAYSVVIGHHVTTDTGTGIVHIAPAYGEDDYIIGEKQDLGFVAHIDNSGKTYNLLDNNGVFVFDFNDFVIEQLKKDKVSLHIGTVDHSYPHCWRCDTPLIYRGISAWYVAVEQIRDKMIANNEKITWVPDAIKHGRFGKWVEQARDWNISRNRYWGSALPIWQSEDKKEEVCIGSIEELYELNKDFGQIEKKDNKFYYSNNGREIDLHKHFVDEIFVKNEKNFIGKNILLVHGRGTDINSEKWVERKRIFEENGMNLDLFQFDKSDDPTYESWKETFDKINFEKYDVVYTSSLGGLMTTKYLIDNDIKVKRLVMAVPGISYSTIKGEKPNIAKIWENIENKLTNNIADEIIVLHAKDDEIVPFEAGKNFSNKLKANFIEFEKGGHSLEGHLKILMGTIKRGTPLKRIPEVLDCWFESGAMPYASKHFPFENSDNFKFPADFIAEGLDQTRGWFYTLLILGTALFDNTPFLNCIVNGIVLAEDGKKMSKRLKNYPEVDHIFNNYGADAMRFYLMNSPVVAAEDLRFTETGVEEVVKKVILPLWNTYSFFTTYANIDGFEPKKGGIYFSRHGESESNIKSEKGVISGGSDNPKLTKKGIEQAIKAGKKAKISGIKFDAIYCSPLIRAKQTAETIANELGYKGKIIELEGLKEQDYAEFEGMTHLEISEKYGVDVNDKIALRKIFKNSKKENIEQFNDRVDLCINQIIKDNEGKNVLVVGHAGTYRPFIKKFMSLDLEYSHYEIPTIPNSQIIKLPNVYLKNPLDKWIISELNKLILDVQTSFDSYRINEATRPIVGFLDNLTNWYVRRSRKRFWTTGLQDDKVEAYETLYEVLVELCKVLAPVMPFISEHIYKNLTGKKSIHLDVFPTVNKSFILDSLNSSFDKTARLVNLGLAWRGRNKIRVRQPLLSATIGENLDLYYQEILKDELNVKEIIILEDASKIAKKVCRPNAKLIGPKFGKDVQKVIIEAKSGNFEELDNGKIKVGEFILEGNEYEIAYEKSDETLDIESGFGMVIAINSKLTPELIQEGLARDIVRHIQESRKEANFNVDDRIKIELSTTNEDIKNSIKNFKSYIENETLSNIDIINSPDFEKEIEIEEFKLKLKLKK